MSRRAYWVALLVLLVPASACERAPLPSNQGYAGVWVLRAGDVPFMVLTLEERNGSFTGSLAAPEHWSTSDGVTFEQVGPGSVVKPISAASADDKQLRLVINAKDPADNDEYVFTLTDADHGALEYVGVPFEPWVFTRHRSGVPTVGGQWDKSRFYALNATRPVPNAEMTAILEADQSARQSSEEFMKHAAQIGRDDAERRRRTKTLLDEGRLRAGEDFYNAAFVFQHGETPDDFLLAHTFAMVALAKGYHPARWIATATLDRYLTSMAGFRSTARSSKPAAASSRRHSTRR